jgi:DNA-binding transcriptional LysR family regulator
MVDAAIITLPLKHPDVRIELLRRDRMMACLRREDPLARKAALETADLRANLTIFYDPQRHPEAHTRLLESLSEAGISVPEYSRASHPSEMQTLVKEGHGLALIRAGTLLEESLTTRPILGVDWTVDTAIIYHKLRHPKTVPILVRRLKRMIVDIQPEDSVVKIVRPVREPAKRPAQSAGENPAQLSLYRESF